jgi:hypothetical protein
MKTNSYILLMFTAIFSQSIIAQTDSHPSISIPEVVISTCPGDLSPNEAPRSTSIIKPIGIHFRIEKVDTTTSLMRLKRSS